MTLTRRSPDVGKSFFGESQDSLSDAPAKAPRRPPAAPQAAGEGAATQSPGEGSLQRPPAFSSAARGNATIEHHLSGPIEINNRCWCSPRSDEPPRAREKTLVARDDRLRTRRPGRVCRVGSVARLKPQKRGWPGKPAKLVNCHTNPYNSRTCSSSISSQAAAAQFLRGEIGAGFATAHRPHRPHLRPHRPRLRPHRPRLRPHRPRWTADLAGWGSWGSWGRKFSRSFW